LALGSYWLHQLVRVYILAGQPEKAIDSLERLLKIHYYVSPAWLTIDTQLRFPARQIRAFQKRVAGGKVTGLPGHPYPSRPFRAVSPEESATMEPIATTAHPAFLWPTRSRARQAPEQGTTNPTLSVSHHREGGHDRPDYFFRRPSRKLAVGTKNRPPVTGRLTSS
jgi:hypothetical protein